MRGLSLVAASGGHSSSRRAGLSLSRPLLLRSTGSRHAGSVVVARGPSRSTACGIFPDQGSNPCPLHWQADSQPLRHQGSPQFFLMFPVWWQWHALSHLFDGLGKESTLGFWYHLGWSGDRQDLVGWLVVLSLLGKSLVEGAGHQAHWWPHSGGSCWLKPTLSDSLVTFATFWSHKWLFWKRLRWDPFQKEEGRRAIEPNGTQENHFMRLK